jgi:hypothetical protein
MLTVCLLALPYAKPAVCAMGGQGAMSTDCGKCDESVPSEGDDQGCDEFASCCAAVVALDADQPVLFPTLPVSRQYEVCPPQRLLGNPHPPLTPPPRA